MISIMRYIISIVLYCLILVMQNSYAASEKNEDDSEDEVQKYCDKIRRDINTLKKFIKIRGSGKDSGEEQEDEGQIAVLRSNKKLSNVLVHTGSVVRGVLVTGLDAETNEAAQKNGKTILVRLISNTLLPNALRRDLKGCHVLCAGYGSISAERVYADAYKLSCVFKDGTVIEEKIDGYVVGGDGRSGISGSAVERDSSYINFSLFSGIFSGLANVAIPKVTKRGVVHTKEQILNSLSAGASHTCNTLANYYVQRAEKLMPIVQIMPGQVVDIVFRSSVARR